MVREYYKAHWIRGVEELSPLLFEPQPKPEEAKTAASLPFWNRDFGGKPIPEKSMQGYKIAFPIVLGTTILFGAGAYYYNKYPIDWWDGEGDPKKRKPKELEEPIISDTK